MDELHTHVQYRLHTLYPRYFGGFHTLGSLGELVSFDPLWESALLAARENQWLGELHTRPGGLGVGLRESPMWIWADVEELHTFPVAVVGELHAPPLGSSAG